MNLRRAAEPYASSVARVSAKVILELAIRGDGDTLSVQYLRESYPVTLWKGFKASANSTIGRWNMCEK